MVQKKLAGKPRPRLPKTETPVGTEPVRGVPELVVHPKLVGSLPTEVTPMEVALVRKAIEKNPDLLPTEPPPKDPEMPKPDEFKILEQQVEREERIFEHFETWYTDWKIWLKEHNPQRSPAANPCGTRRATGLVLDEEEKKRAHELDLALGMLDSAFEAVEDALGQFRAPLSYREEKLDQLRKSFATRTGVPNIEEYRRLAGVKG